MSAKYGRGSISLQSPVIYQFEYECKTSFEFVMRKKLTILFDIVGIATNGKPLLKQSSSFTAVILLVVRCANDDCNVLPRSAPKSVYN